MDKRISEMEYVFATMLQIKFRVLVSITVILYILSYFIDPILVFFALAIVGGVFCIVLSDFVMFLHMYGYSSLGIKYKESDGIYYKE